ncbi:unnamed protein product [Polarella glacialis]|uniref:Peptidase A1 domain-containing protein n=1 Tax=Polarella glacialis TaxID=89957 RepID=A0A813EJ74_POLGL|nr:unnamed protein product [Polarella glacialis]CAE8711545.1 unnamed protein product [Polarella glacialis]
MLRDFLVEALVTGTSAGCGVSLPLGRATTHGPARSGVAARLGGRITTPSGSSIDAGGSVWPTAIYWTLVQIGTPPQDFPVAIDSGSGDLDVGGKGCKGCVTTAQNRGYDPTASSTSQKAAPYNFSNTYETCDLKHPTAPCTITGDIYSDQVGMAGLGFVDVKVGSIMTQDSNFDQFKEIDGVVGFTRNGKDGEGVFRNLVAAGKAYNAWAMCMHEGSHSNGTITIGGVDGRLSDGPIQYVPDTGDGDYEVKVETLVLGETTIKLNQNSILDTGTNILLLPSKMLAEVNKQMCADSSLTSCSDLWANKCVSLTEAQVDAFPSLTLRLTGGVDLVMTSRDYLLLGSPVAHASGEFCLGIRDGGSLFIIGDTTMRHYYLVFDLAAKRIGWGKVNKDTCGSDLSAEVQTEMVV